LFKRSKYPDGILPMPSAIQSLFVPRSWFELDCGLNAPIKQRALASRSKGKVQQAIVADLYGDALCACDFPRGLERYMRCTVSGYVHDKVHRIRFQLNINDAHTNAAVPEARFGLIGNHGYTSHETEVQQAFSLRDRDLKACACLLWMVFEDAFNCMAVELSAAKGCAQRQIRIKLKLELAS
jgi:hypothetical protein